MRRTSMTLNAIFLAACAAVAVVAPVRAYAGDEGAERAREEGRRASDAAPEEQGFLGVGTEWSGKGVVITDVGAGTPAERARLRAGDVVVAADGRRLESAEALLRAVRAKRPGESIRLEVVREGWTRAFSVVLAPVPPEIAGSREREEDEPSRRVRALEPEVFVLRLREEEARGRERLLETLRRELDAKSYEAVRRALESLEEREPARAAPGGPPPGERAEPRRESIRVEARPRPAEDEAARLKAALRPLERRLESLERTCKEIQKSLEALERRLGR
jgi:membrane-associated protease RseP (regulator of RpoE activity)